MATDRALNLAGMQRRVMRLAALATALAAAALFAGPWLRSALWPRPEAAAIPEGGEVPHIDIFSGGRVERFAAAGSFELEADQFAVLEVGGSRILLLGGTRFEIGEVRSDAGGVTRVDMSIEEGVALVSVGDMAEGSLVRIRSTEGIVTAVSSCEAEVRVGAGGGLRVSVVGGEVRGEDSSGRIRVLREGERLLAESGQGRVEGMTPQEIEELRALIPSSIGRALAIPMPTDPPTQANHRPHERFLQGLSLQTIRWFEKNEARAVLAWVTEPFQIGEERRLTRRLLGAYLDQLTSRHRVRRIVVDGNSVFMEWTEVDGAPAVQLSLDGYLEAIEPEETGAGGARTGSKSPRRRQETPAVDGESTGCIAALTFEAKVLFVWGDAGWRAGRIDVTFKVVDPRVGRERP